MVTNDDNPKLAELLTRRRNIVDYKANPFFNFSLLWNFYGAPRFYVHMVIVS